MFCLLDKNQNCIGFISSLVQASKIQHVLKVSNFHLLGLKYQKLDICKLIFLTVPNLTYQVYSKISSVFSLHSIEMKFQFYSNFSHFKFNTGILTCQVALNFNCHHFFHGSNCIFEMTFSSEIYRRTLSNLTIKISKLFWGSFWNILCPKMGLDWRVFMGNFKVRFLLWRMGHQVEAAYRQNPFDEFKDSKYQNQFLIYSIEMCGGAKPCNILRWISQTFQEKWYLNLNALNEKFDI